LFFDQAYFKPDPARSEIWNRGAYLVEALGHCGACHTPRNFMGAMIAGRRLQGAQIDEWYAPDITPKALATINKWSKPQLIAFLKKGAASNSTALGPMREVVHDSLSYLTDNDLNAMATYLLDTPEDRDVKSTDRVATLTPGVLTHAAKLYAEQCASCHGPAGAGIPNAVPPIAGNPAVVSDRPYNVLAAVLAGIPARGDMMAMPGFGGALSDRDVADIANYVRTSWGNAGAPNATPGMVAAWRSTLALPVYASAAARAFDCPQIGQGGDPSLDPAVIAGLSGRVGKRWSAYATLVASYRARHPRAGMADIVNNLIAAYCPIVAETKNSDEAKRMAVKRFALNITSYLSSQSIAKSVPDVGIIWATPAGYSLAEHDATGSTTLTCPANDNVRVPRALVAAATEIGGKPDLNFRADEVLAQTDSMIRRDPTSKLADVANAMIMAYCRSVSGLTGVSVAEKEAALERYGEIVIEALQHTAEQRAHASSMAGQR
jgi:mono/diheme cytochrome c family protein